MLQGEEIAFNGLEVCSYRYLQGMAKNMGLPSNVKKVHLIEMIRAKKYCTESDLQAIVDRVKMERKVNAQAKKKKPQRKPYGLQGAEISSTSNSQSPPIMTTPKRPSDFIIQYSPDITQTIMKYHQPKQNLLCSETSILQPLKRHIESDRVLRSFNSAKRPNYRIMEQNDCIDVVACSSMQEIQEIRQEHAYQSVNVTVQKHRPVVTTTVIMNQDRQLVPVHRSCNITKPAKRQRKISGIYPLQVQDKPVYEYVPTVGFRRTDGRVTKINAVIQKPLESTLLPKNRAIKISKKSLVPRNQLFSQNQALVPKRTLTVQDMINYKVDHQSLVTKDRESNMYQMDCQANEIIRQACNEKWIDERAIENLDSEVSYVSQTDMYSQARNIDPNASRKVYKGQKDKAKKWNYSIEYPDNEGASKKEWNIYDINGQSLDKTDNNKINQVNTNEPISTTYRDPISRDYQVEYQKFNQEIAVRNIRNSDHFDQNTRNIDPRSNMKDGHVQGMLDKNMNYRSDHRLSNPGTDRNNDNTLGIDQQITSRQVNDRSTKDQYDQDRRICNQRFNPSDKNRSEIQNEVFIDNRIHANAKERYVIDLTDRNRSIDTNRSDQKFSDQRHSDQQLSDQRLSDQRLSDQQLSEQRHSDQQLSEQRHSDQRLSDQRSIDQPDISSQYPNMSALTDVFPNDLQSKESNYSVYYHKKIRAEHVKCQKVKEQLPRITDVFSQFNDVQFRNLNQPLYVHVSAESERVPTKQPMNINSTCMLETIYNFKNVFVTNPPVLMIVTTHTHCTSSTQTISTAVAQPAVPELCNNSYERVDSYQGDSTSRVCDSLKPQLRPTTDFSCDEVLSWSTTSLETRNSLSLGANVTIPERVEELEDVLELISQDGDYMERIGMDVRVQCMFCDWAGPKIILEYHIKKDHANKIVQSIDTDCTVVCPVGSLSSTWSGQVLCYGPALYVLSGQATGYTVQLALSMIPTETEFETKRARITVYNKITGQPFSYESEIKEIPDTMPYEYGLDCLKLDISQLNVISANSLDREVIGSQTQTELNNVEIVVYVKFLD